MGLAHALVVAQGLQGSLGHRTIRSSACKGDFLKKEGHGNKQKPLSEILGSQALFRSLLQSSEKKSKDSRWNPSCLSTALESWGCHFIPLSLIADTCHTEWVHRNSVLGDECWTLWVIESSSLLIFKSSSIRWSCWSDPHSACLRWFQQGSIKKWIWKCRLNPKAMFK